MNRRIILASVGLLAACATQEQPVVPAPPAPPPTPPALSTPFVVAPAASVVSAEQDVYISLPPDSIPAGVTATITDRRNGASATAAIVAGGFDPVAIPAITGDSIAVTVQTSGGQLSFALAAPPAVPPVVVRTDPVPHKRDVPLNASLVIVFSQPIDAATLTGNNVQVVDGTLPPVAGQLSFSDAQHTSATFAPTAPLAPNTDYAITVGSGIRDTHGKPLAAPVSVAFTTGQATTTSTPAASVTVSPLAVTLAVGSTVALSATAKDAAGNVLTGQTLSWTSSAPALATVATSGVVTAVSRGVAVISAQSGGVTGSATITVTPAGPSVRFTSVTVGTQQSCALTTDGVAYCWGEPQSSGTGSLVNSSVPLPVNTQLRFSQLVAGMYQTCGVTTDHALYCWGGTPTRILPGVSVKSVSVGGSHQCALATSGAAYCWGFGYYGELGGDSAAFAATCPASSSIVQVSCDTPTPVAGGLLFNSINADNVETTCGVTTSGAAYCWGDNLFATLGVGSNVGPQGCIGDELDFGPIAPLVYPCSTVPAAVTGGQLFSDIQSECGLASDSRIYCWGTNQDGILGVGSTTGPSTCSYDTPSGPGGGACSTVPVPVGGGQSSFIQLSGSDARHCGLTTAGAVYCWGRWGAWNNGGGYQYPTPSSTAPVLIGGGIVFTSIGVSGDHGCGVTAAGVVYCWGGNGWGQLGDGTTTPSAVPVRVLQP